jgi:ankyrin repeat protein
MPSENDPPIEDKWTWLRTERLHRAAAKGDLSKIERLLTEGYDIDAFDEDLPRTPLHYAAIENQADAVRRLIRAGANVNANDSARIGDTPLGAVADSCSLEIAKLLIDAGADPTISGWMQLTALDRSEGREDREGLRVYNLLYDTARRLNPDWPRLSKFTRKS